MLLNQLYSARKLPRSSDMTFSFTGLFKLDFVFMQAAKATSHRQRMGEPIQCWLCLLREVYGVAEERGAWMISLSVQSAFILLWKSADCVQSAKRFSAPWIVESVFFSSTPDELFSHNIPTQISNFLCMNGNVWIYLHLVCTISMLFVELFWTATYTENAARAFYDGWQMYVCATKVLMFCLAQPLTGHCEDIGTCVDILAGPHNVYLATEVYY